MKKLLWLGVAIIVSIGLVAIFVHRTRRVKVAVDVAKVEKDIREHLNIGASRADVESYLDQRGIEHSFVKQSKPGPEPSPVEIAMIHDSSRTWLVRGDIHIVFNFDDHEKLVAYSVKEIFTGP